MNEDIRKMIDKLKNFKQSINEHVEIEKDLELKLLSFGGKSVKLGLDSDVEQKRMFYDGRIYNEKIMFANGIPNQCHRNISDKYKNSTSSNFKIISGYALYNNEWIQHSWGFIKNNIIESTKIKFELYYGYELTPEESDEFCFSNY